MHTIKKEMESVPPPWELDPLKERDLHVHTKYCRHAEGSMEDYVLSAIKKGLKEIGFLAHVEVRTNWPRRTWLTDEELEIYWESGLSLREKYAGHIHVSLGLEVGVHPDALEDVRDVMARRAWDRIGLSCHFVKNGDGLINMSSRYSVPEMESLDQRALTMRYYQTLVTFIPLIKPFMVCHLDVPRKFLKDYHYDPEIKSLVRRVLWEMAQNQVKLEINTSGYTTVGAPYPASWILPEARALGVLPVLCSDSHKPEQVGRYYDEAIDYIKQALEASSHAESQ